MKRKKSAANNTLAVIGGVVYVSLLLLFGWQTWAFVNWLFPDDQMLMIILTVLSFDGCALLFGCIHLFYRFASRGAKHWVTAGWIVTNVLSALASVFYLVIESMFRFHLFVNQQTVDVGYGISIIALIFDGLVLTMWVYLEWKIRHPHQDDFAEFEEDEEPSDLSPEFVRSVTPDTYKQYEAQEQQPASTPVQPHVSAQPEIDYVKLAQALKAVEQQASSANGHAADAAQAFTGGQTNK